MPSSFYITTPIYYPNAEPHIGHAYTTIAADTVARYRRLTGMNVRLLTGTDEHGIKMVKTAAEQGIEPKELTDRVVAVFEQVWKELDITHDDFIRTTSERHKQGVSEIVRRLVAHDDVYLGEYSGWYDEGQEEFVTETEAKTNDYKSAISKRPLTRYTEKSYFFRLTKYLDRVREHIEANPEFLQPTSRRNEVLSKLSAGVGDLSISRVTLKWGIPMPHDPEHVIFVWIDALSNYITALGYGSADDSLYKEFWPADVHLIGKEILWFHCVYWPAMLMALGEPLPEKVFAHGWWTSDGQKMGKSLGNFIGLEKLRDIGRDYGYDALRYHLLRAAPFGSDLDWTDADFHKSFNELADVIGNCLNRIINMTTRYRDGIVPAAGRLEEIDQTLIAKAEQLGADLSRAYDNLELQQCALLPVELARAVNGYIEATRPFSLAKDPAQADRLSTVLHVAANAMTKALAAALPVLPEKAAAGLSQLNVAIEGKTLNDLLKPLRAGHKLGEGKPLFPKLDAGAKKK